METASAKDFADAEPFVGDSTHGQRVAGQQIETNRADFEARDEPVSWVRSLGPAVSQARVQGSGKPVP